MLSSQFLSTYFTIQDLRNLQSHTFKAHTKLNAKLYPTHIRRNGNLKPFNMGGSPSRHSHKDPMSSVTDTPEKGAPQRPLATFAAVNKEWQQHFERITLRSCHLCIIQDIVECVLIYHDNPRRQNLLKHLTVPITLFRRTACVPGTCCSTISDLSLELYNDNDSPQLEPRTPLAPVAPRRQDFVRLPSVTCLSYPSHFTTTTDDSLLKGLPSLRHIKMRMEDLSYPVMRERLQPNSLEDIAARNFSFTTTLDSFTITGPGRINAGMMSAAIEGICSAQFTKLHFTVPWWDRESRAGGTAEYSFERLTSQRSIGQPAGLCYLGHDSERSSLRSLTLGCCIFTPFGVERIMGLASSAVAEMPKLQEMWIRFTEKEWTAFRHRILEGKDGKDRMEAVWFDGGKYGWWRVDTPICRIWRRMARKRGLDLEIRHEHMAYHDGPTSRYPWWSVTLEANPKPSWPPRR